MSYKYFPHTPKDIETMLAKCGKQDISELYADIPEDLQFNRSYDLPEAMSEIELRRHFNELGNEYDDQCYMGAGVYNHYCPSVVADIVGRSEFLTSYTPYQAEISQGTLQYIFEFQSMMATLTGMEVSNASMYDGCTATAEAMMMAVASAKKRNRVLISSTVNPQVKSVVETYAKYHGITLDTIAEIEGVTDRADLDNKLATGDVAGVIVASPNYYGIIEDYSGLADKVHENKALLIMNCIASTLGVLKTPAEWGADIAVGDGQSLGIPMDFGGPYVGFLCTSKKLIRKMPGRIVGATHDLDGKRAFVLTLQAREQHIRREKATSNICSNQSLMALQATVYLSLMGKKGLREVNVLGANAAHYMADELTSIPGINLTYPDKPFLNEFAITFDESIDFDTLQDALRREFHFGVKIAPHTLLVCCTEMNTKQDIDFILETLKSEEYGLSKFTK